MSRKMCTSHWKSGERVFACIKNGMHNEHSVSNGWQVDHFSGQWIQWKKIHGE